MNKISGELSSYFRMLGSCVWVEINHVNLVVASLIICYFKDK